MLADKYKLFDTLIEGVHVINRDWIYTYVNPASAHHFNLCVTDMIDKNVYELFPIVTGTDIEGEMIKCMEQQSTFDEIVSLSFPRDIERWFDVKLRPIEEGILVIMLDITERKEQGFKLQKNELKYKELYNSMIDSYIITEVLFDEKNEFSDLKFLEVNRATFDLYGERKENMIGKKRSELFGPLDQKFRQKIREAIATKKAVKYIREIPKLKIWVDLTIVLIRDNQIAMLSKDITKRVMSEKKLKRFNKKLEVMIDNRTRELAEALEREKSLTEIQGHFLSMASHELKAPLSSINVCLDVLQKNETLTKNESFKKYIGYIHQEIGNSLDLINNLVSPTNRLISEMGTQNKSLHLTKMINSLTIGLGEVTRHNQNIIHTHEGTNDLILNKGILRRIIINLLSNAIKYSKKDITIKTKIGDNKLNISIADQGIGIPKKEQVMVFRKFFRADNAQDIIGTGLGLNVVKTYVEMLDGTIDFDSEENFGTTFYIDIPL